MAVKTGLLCQRQCLSEKILGRFGMGEYNNGEFGRLNRLKWVLSIILESKAIPILYNKIIGQTLFFLFQQNRKRIV